MKKLTKRDFVNYKVRKEVQKGKKVYRMTIRTWSHRQLKKARWKRSLERAIKRETVHRGLVKFTDEIMSW